MHASESRRNLKKALYKMHILGVVGLVSNIVLNHEYAWLP